MWPHPALGTDRLSRTALTEVLSLEDVVSSSWDGAGGWGCSVVSAVGAVSTSPSGTKKKMQFRIEIREHGALPKLSPGTVLGLGAQPMEGKQRERLLHGVSCTGGHTSLTPGYGAQQLRGQLHHMPPHATAKELLTRAMPFPSLLGLLLCHCSVELLQSRGKCLPFSCTADPGQGLWEEVEAPSPWQEITCQGTLPQSCCGAEKGL